jgi:capsule biosynthesis phosphatase
MRIVVDLDGTICTLKKPEETYADVLPMPGAVFSLRKLKQEGHEIVIYTARNMKTTAGNVGKVHANVGKLTLDWLEQYGIPFDEIVFGKPIGDIYVDDLGYRFRDWENVLLDLEKGKSP